MRNKDLRKWMRKFVFSQADGLEGKQPDQIEIRNNKVVGLSDSLAVSLKYFMARTTKHKSTNLKNLSRMALAEFKREFVDSDDEVKITLLYGLLTSKNVFVKGEKEEELILIKKEHGGFGMLNSAYTQVDHSEIVDNTQELRDYIEEQKEIEKRGMSWAESNKNIKSFLLRSRSIIEDETNKPRTPVNYMTGSSKGKSSGGLKPLTDLEINASGKYAFFATKEELFSAMKNIGEEGKKAFMARVLRTVSGYAYRLITVKDLQLEYQVLAQALEEAKSRYDTNPTDINKEKYNVAAAGMQEHKASAARIARTFADAIKNSKDLKSLNFNQKDFLSNLGVEIKSKADVVKVKKTLNDLQYSKKNRMERGIKFDKEGNFISRPAREKSPTVDLIKEWRGELKKQDKLVKQIKGRVDATGLGGRYTIRGEKYNRRIQYNNAMRLVNERELDKKLINENKLKEAKQLTKALRKIMSKEKILMNRYEWYAQEKWNALNKAKYIEYLDDKKVKSYENQQKIVGHKGLITKEMLYKKGKSGWYDSKKVGGKYGVEVKGQRSRMSNRLKISQAHPFQSAIGYIRKNEKSYLKHMKNNPVKYFNYKGPLSTAHREAQEHAKRMRIERRLKKGKKIKTKNKRKKRH